MRTRRFNVPSAILGQFFSYTEDQGLEPLLIEVTDSNELVVDLDYEDNMKEVIMSLIEMIDDSIEI